MAGEWWAAGRQTSKNRIRHKPDTRNDPSRAWRNGRPCFRTGRRVLPDRSPALTVVMAVFKTGALNQSATLPAFEIKHLEIRRREQIAKMPPDCHRIGVKNGES